MSPEEIKIDNFFLASVCLSGRIGCKRSKQLLKYFSDGASIWKADRDQLLISQLSEQIIDSLIHFRNQYPDCPEQLAEFCRREKIKLCSIRDENYPEILKEIEESAPTILYYRGELKPREPRIAIVGTRQATSYGIKTALKMAREIAASGITVVSGAATGIDTFAHKGALETGRTVAVLGEGLAVVQPKEKQKLLDRISENGAVISELGPRITAKKGTFPQRNRIIAGLSDGVVVVEAGERSGAISTAGYAGDYGKILFAVPGNIDREKSRGCHVLIRDGAILTRNFRDILEDCKFNFVDNKIEENKINVENPVDKKINLPELEGNEKIIFDLIPSEIAISVDDLAANLEEFSMSEINSTLTSLEAKGYIIMDDFGNYIHN
ncbi:MAG: DNA-processing protein DprA [Selenomonadaceae bacterium]|nr:DNA-processing protein DprA [Selenomonadaceae bacterium]